MKKGSFKNRQDEDPTKHVKEDDSYKVEKPVINVTIFIQINNYQFLIFFYEILGYIRNTHF